MKSLTLSVNFIIFYRILKFIEKMMKLWFILLSRYYQFVKFIQFEIEYFWNWIGLFYNRKYILWKIYTKTKKKRETALNFEKSLNEVTNSYKDFKLPKLINKITNEIF